MSDQLRIEYLVYRLMSNHGIRNLNAELQLG